MNKEEIKKTVPNIPGVYLCIKEDNSTYIGFTTKLKKALTACSEEYVEYKILYTINLEYENKEVLYKELLSFINNYITEYPETIILNSINNKPKQEDYIVLDKSEWVKCKDLVQNYEYISISPKSLSIIIGCSEKEIKKALNKEIAKINDRFIVNKFE